MPGMTNDDTTKWIEAVLSNDENTTDEELLAYFTDNGVTAEDAASWIAKRDAYLNHPRCSICGTEISQHSETKCREEYEN
jgi:hypothetical protein